MNSDNKFIGIIHRVLADISTDEAEALYHWTGSLLALRYTNQPGKDKFKTVIRLTRNAPILFPLIKRIAMELKKTGWDDASWQSRLGTGAMLWATFAIANAGAGLAMLGGAIAVPLWIVFGSGDKFAKKMIDALKNISKGD